MISIYRSTD